MRPGTLIDGRFELERLLGEGGFGEVWIATQLSVQRKVAIKTLHGHLLSGGGAGTELARFNREAHLTSQLQHPNTVVVFDYGKDQDLGVYYLVMEFLEGEDLRTWLKRRGHLEPDEALHIARQMAASLQNAHESGIVHRDLKPANVMLVDHGGGQPWVKVIDFGIGKLMADAVKRETDTDGKSGYGQQRITQSGAILGTPSYLAPEQCMGGDLTPAVDTYALGVMIFQMLTGERPFPKQDTAIATLQYMMLNPPTSLFVARPELTIPREVDHVLQRTLAKDPARRPESPVALVNALESAMGLGGQPEGSQGNPDDEQTATITLDGGLAIAGSPESEAPTASLPANPDTASGKVASSRKTILLVASAVAVLALGITFLVAWSLSGEGGESDAASGSNSGPEEASQSAQAGRRGKASGEEPGNRAPHENPLAANPEIAEQELENTSATLTAGRPGAEDGAEVPGSNGSSENGDPNPADGVEPGTSPTAADDESDEESSGADSQGPDKNDADQAEEDNEKRSRRAEKVRCRLRVRPWGELEYRGRTLSGSGGLYFLEGRRGRTYKVTHVQNGRDVGQHEVKIPGAGPCSETVGQ